MQNLFIKATPTSPEIDFRFDEHVLSIKGESYPENAAAFYVPVIESVKAFLGACEKVTITVNVSLAYFNSSSTKMLFTLLDLLNASALTGNDIRLNWFRDADDDTIQEFGEELRADFDALDFYDRPLSNL